MSSRRKPSSQTRTLLLALLERPMMWRYGYELSKATALQSGTLYPLMMRLNEQGLLESRWEDSAQIGKPPRHAYRLTPNGKALALSLSGSRQRRTFGPTLKAKPA
jgi:DNA-binding PadR family transcriptional regulator